MIEGLRSRVASYGLRTSYFATVWQHYDLHIDLLMRAADLADGQEPNARKAFEISERARSRTLLDNISEARSGISEGVDPEQLKREKSLRGLLESRTSRYMQLLTENPN